jgi:ABC-type Fe3+/spermidine/putrescine transport system ATPase subunit
MGVVFQDQALFQHMSVEENIAFGLKLRKLATHKIQKTVDEMLQMIRLQDHRRKYPRYLSGGERQRVAIARALAYNPDAMLFDEPFSGLDPMLRTELRRDVRRFLKRLNIPALFITHDQEEALEVADRLAILNTGRLEQIGTPFEISNHPLNEYVATFLGAANVLLGQWHEGQIAFGAQRLKAPPEVPTLSERQPIKVVFRPEDVALNFQPQLLDTPYYLGRGLVEDISYVGPTERLVVRLIFGSPFDSTNEGSKKTRLFLVDETYVENFPIIVSRTKWEATEMELSAGDPVVLGLKNYQVLPHYPLHNDPGAKIVG